MAFDFGGFADRYAQKQDISIEEMDKIKEMMRNINAPAVKNGLVGASGSTGRADELYKKLKQTQTMAKKMKFKKGDEVKVLPIGTDDVYESGYDMDELKEIYDIDFATVYKIEDIDKEDETYYVKDVWFTESEIIAYAPNTIKNAVATGVQKIGSSYVDIKNYNIMKSCMDLNESVLLIGETGTGKTTIIKEIAKEKNKKLTRVSLNGSTGIEEILGKWLAKDGSTYWQDGILTTAMKNGDWIVFDEINSALPEILFALHSLLDDEKKIILIEKDNEIIVPHKDFRFFGTMNPSEDYAGTKDMNKALLSRFNAIIYIEALEPMQEEEVIVQESKADAKSASILVRIGTDLRALKKAEKLFYYCSTRDLVQVGRLISVGIPLPDAVEVAVINKMSKDEATFSDTVAVMARYVNLDPKSVVSFKDIENEHAMQKAEIDSLKNQLATSESNNAKFKTQFIEEMKTLISAKGGSNGDMPF